MAGKEKERKVGGVSAQARSGSAAPARAAGRKVGGVSARMREHREEVPLLGPKAGPISPVHGDFVYNNGPVITCPLIYASFWGNRWLSDAAHLTEAGRLTQFLTDLVASKYMNVLSQYGVGNGPGSGLFIQASFISNVPTTLTDNDIHNVLQNAINGGVIPEPPQNNTTHVQVIYLDESVAVDDSSLGIVMCEPAGDNAFGYHFDFTTAGGNEFYYAVIPALTDDCLKNSCGSDSGCSLHLSQTQEQRRTQVTSHEFAEMVTDPKFTKGWWGSSSDENGDICNGEADNITVGANTWDVQRQYSKFDDINSNGATFCITEAPNPIPKLSPGPSGLTAAMASARRMGTYQALLPLPTAHFDLKTRKLALDETHVRRYVKKFFYPLDHENLFADLPAILRSVADTLEKGKK
jgi:hypothetical protein